MHNPKVFEYRATRLANLPIDDICYFTMRGECSYQLGNYPAALLDYQAALATYMANPNWFDRLAPGGDPTRLDPMRPRSTSVVPWGQRGNLPGDFPATVTVGGVLPFITHVDTATRNTPPSKTIYVQEIVRCTALAIYRWHELGGPLCEYHPFSRQLTTLLRLQAGSRQLPSANPWVGIWHEVESGMLAALEGRRAEAIPKLQQAALFGALDHPLTGYALLMLGRLSGDKPDVAENYFVQASLAAGHYGDLTVVQEALRAAAELHLSAGRKTKFAPLEPAIVWASTAGSLPLEATLLLLAAENDYQLGQIESATARLTAATALVTPTEMAAGRIGARLSFLNALVAYRCQNPLVGEPALQTALAYQRLGSSWQFRAGMIELANFTKTIPEHRAAELYADLFSGPTQAHWLTDPLESLSSLVIPHAPSYERWLELPLVARQGKLAFDIAERTRRHRFLSTLDLGGRMLALRWVLEAPEAALSRSALDERPQIQIRAPSYADVSRRSRELIAELRKLPLTPEEPEDVKRQKKLFAELKQTSVEQEMMLRQLALERQDCELVFPPLKPMEQLQAELGEGQAIWSFLQTSQHVHAFWLTKEDLLAWELEVSPQQIGARIRELLGHWGNPAASHPLTHRDLAYDQWRATAQRLFEDLMKGAKVDFATIKELIIVPDGELWQLPFEALLMPDNSTPLAARVRLRYSPTAGLAVGNARPHREGVSVIVPAKTASREQREAESEHLSELEQAAPDAVVLHPKLTVDPALLSTLIDQLIVCHEIRATGDAYHWSPIPLEAKGAGGLTDWMTLPWGGPDQAFFLGYHGPGGNSRKGDAVVQPVSDLFLSLCGVMATGSRTVLISRWRTGGQTNYDLLREFTQELPHATAAAAWQRAVQTVTAAPLATDQEPRLKHERGAPDPSASHPFFWAGLLMADTGSPPRDE
ncbi:MAG TPA: CHAT domain-containing protein [Pirellulales bacterium]|nr:CHAT domain-containing protein [Pirellulales bacterium]